VLVVTVLDGDDRIRELDHVMCVRPHGCLSFDTGQFFLNPVRFKPVTEDLPAECVNQAGSGNCDSWLHEHLPLIFAAFLTRPAAFK
jgi:hypothetical protein